MKKKKQFYQELCLLMPEIELIKPKKNRKKLLLLKQPQMGEHIIYYLRVESRKTNVFNCFNQCLHCLCWFVSSY